MFARLIFGLSLSGAALCAQHTNLRYAAFKDTVLDLETPAGNGPFRLIAAVHGGGWSGGGRADARRFCRVMVESGFACAALDYRLAPETPFPGQIEDLKNAIVWLLSHARGFQLETDGVILAGESAGGHLVTYLGAQHPAGLPILGVVAFSPPTDLVALGEPGRALGLTPPEVRALTGAAGWNDEDIERMRRASPLFALHSGAPAFLIFHGDADQLVPVEQSRAFCEAARTVGGACDLALIAGARHGLWNEEQFDLWVNVWKPTFLAWMNLHAGKSRSQPTVRG